MPRISIITPTYNAADHIGRTIASVQAQTFGDWEHIIIDDGSTDDTRAVIAACRDNRLRTIFQPNQGPSEARNHGVRISGGDYLIFLDAGDWWDEHCLELLLGCMQSDHSGCVITHGDWAFADGNGHVGRVRSSAFAHGEGLNTLLFYNPMAIHTVLAPRLAITAVDGFRPSGTLEDWNLWVRLARSGCRYIHLPRLVAYYHWQPNSRSKNIERRKTERLATLDHFWPAIDSADPLQAIRGQSYATAYVDLCVSRFGQGDIDRALEEFDAAVTSHRPIIGSIDTYYRIAYAEQSAYEGASETLHESLAEPAAGRRIEQVLAHIAGRYTPAESRAARCAAYAALGLAEYHEHRHTRARDHLWSAVRAEPAALFDRTVGGTLVKSLLPVKLMDDIREWRRGQ